MRRLLSSAGATSRTTSSPSRARSASCSSRPSRRLFHIAHEDRTGELRSIADVLHDELDKLERVSREGISVTGTPSGFKDLDEKTGGFQPDNLSRAGGEARDGEVPHRLDAHLRRGNPAPGSESSRAASVVRMAVARSARR